MADDVLLNKAAAIERAVQRVRDEYGGDDGNLVSNQTRQDAIVLNLQRACESSIDAAMHMVRVHRLGIPQETREAFALLEGAGLHLSDRLKKMVVSQRRYSRLSEAEPRHRATHHRGSPRRFSGLHAAAAAVLKRPASRTGRAT
jgi:hypothetical protein